MSPLVMFVEDDEALRDSASQVLKFAGYRVETAKDGVEALERLDVLASPPDLIVSDIAMPRMNGLEFFRKVREKGHLRGVPFIFLTAFASRQDVLRGRRLGVDDYLVKPFDPEDFLAAIENKLRRVQELREDVEGALSDARRTLVQLLSHELRTPLTYVSGGQALIAEALEGDPEHLSLEALRDNLSLITSGAERLTRLADQMVTYTELRTGQAAVRLKESAEVVDIVEALLSVISELESDEMWNMVHYKLTVSEHETFKVLGVSDLLFAAFGEVLRNAAFFSDPDGDVTVKVRREDAAAVIVIQDQGAGIKDEDLPHIWDPLIQSERAVHEQQGLGLGLAITKGVIELHGGACGIDSRVNYGTTVTLRLPLK